MATSVSRSSRAALALALLAACSSRSTPGEARSPATLPGGTAVAVTLDTPAPGAVVAVPPGDVRVAGLAALGVAPATPATSLVVALDASPGTSAPATCGEEAATILGCELAAARALAARGATTGTVAEVAAVLFAGEAAPLDLSPAEGAQPTAAPAADVDADGTPDVAEAIASTAPGGVATTFAALDLADAPASLGAPLAAGGALAAASTLPTRVLVLVSATPAAGAPAVADVTVPEGLVIRAFAVGRACDAPSAFGSLADLVARGAAGSACLQVAPADLAAALAAVLDASLDGVTLAVDGGAAEPLATTPPLPAAAPVSATFETTVAALALGLHELCVTATGTDAAGTRGETTCATVAAATLALSPEEATYELGPGMTATLTAAVVAGEDGGVEGVPVEFVVLEGPNAGEGGTVPTDAEGAAAFTYDARQHLEGLGTDVIEACFTDGDGAKSCDRASVTWQDTTPPAMSCPPGPNPGGHIVAARAAGFMRLIGVDAVDPEPELWLEDTGSGKVWGPFASGKSIKYTQAPGATPGAKLMGSVLHVTGNGDPALTGEDAVGNVSEPLVCAVPPWLK